jgi:hypothetical protein
MYNFYNKKNNYLSTDIIEYKNRNLLAWIRHKNVVGLKRFMTSLTPHLLDCWM